MKELGRLLTAMVTPFDERGEVDYAQARRLAVALVDSGSDGVVTSGTTGECPTLSAKEKLRLCTEVKEAVGDRGVVVAGTGTYSTAESQELTREAAKAGADGCLLVVPYYNRPPQEGLYQHFKAVAGVTELPCILYNVPSRTGTNMAPETVVRLAAVDNIVGVKEASGNMDQAARIIEGVKRQDFFLWSGNDSDTLPLMALGGYGVISVASHLLGLQIREMIRKHLAGDTAGATAIYLRIMPMMCALFVVANPIPLKYALNRVGFPVGRPRLPLVEADEKAAAAIDAALQGTTIDLPR
jgi:4-hydroxy-tetrahydrodipicolinate synthase